MIIILCGANAQAQTVDFTADNWSGCGTAYVQFTNQSTTGGSAVWDFGDGGANSTLWNATRSFNRPGTFNVTLTVTYPSGTSRSVTHTVRVYNKPDVRFSTTPITGCTPLVVNFQDQSSAGDGTITSINWDFGDGNGSTGATASHTYTAGGNITATSIVTNSFGCIGSGGQNIRVNATPVASFTSNVQGGCKAPLTVNFTNTTTLNTSVTTAVNYQWDFGDGTTSSDMHPSHTYTSMGSFPVRLTATTADGCTHTVTQNNYIVIASTLQADFTIQQSACAGANLTFQNTTQPAPVSATWTFSDGTVQNTVDAVKSFPAAGDYSVTLRSITQDGCEATVTRTFHINDKPTATFTVQPIPACRIPTDATVTYTGSGATSWAWNFGDGGTSTGQNPTHRYTAERAYNIFLTATNAQGCVDTHTVVYLVKMPTLAFTGPLAGCVPMTATYRPSGVSADPFVSFAWDFGDGGTSTQQVPTYTFTRAGTFIVRLTVTTRTGCTRTFQQTVRVGTPVSVDFTVDKTTGCQSTPFNFTDLSTPQVAGMTWLWSFRGPTGVTTTATTQNPTVTFGSVGQQDVTLTINNNGCTTTLTKSDYVETFPPQARFTIGTVDCANLYRRVFTDNSDFGASPTQMWNWNFGDGVTSNQQSPTHTYTAGGTYTVTLTVDNGSCTSTTTQIVRVLDTKPVIYATPATICRDNPVAFTSDPLSATEYPSFVWAFGDGNTATGSSASYTYTTAGIYNAIATTTDMYGCQHVSDPLTITVNGSDANFTIAARQCKDEQITFTDNSTTRAGNTIVSWTWDFGDGSAPVVYNGSLPASITHTYTTFNDFPVKLTVRDNTGCENSFTDVVHIANIVASFGANGNIACLNQPFQFNNTSVTEPLTYAWTFGDGGTSTDQSPAHTYTTAGNYTVTLDITGSTGCTSHAEITNFIRVPNPVANFSYPPIAADICPPIKVQFTNSSTDFVSSAWDFGDGSTSSEDNPLHNYIRPGTFPVTLTVFSEGGCPSAPAGPQNLFIAGPDGSFTVTPQTGCWPLTTSMSATSLNAVVKYIWDFGDGYSVTTTTPNSPSYTYQREGAYYPVVLLEDSRGCRVAAAGTPTVVADKIKGQFTADLTQACDGGTVYFAATSTGVSNDLGNVPTYTWDFGITGRTDDVGSGASANFVYNTPGTYTVTLRSTTDYGCNHDTTLNIEIEATPAAEIVAINPFCTGSTIQLQGRDNRNLPGTQWLWSVNNQLYNTVTPPPVTFSQASSYPVQLTITSASGNCKSTDLKYADAVAYPTLDPSPDSSGICLGNSLQLQANTDAGVQVAWTNYNISDPNSISPVVNPTVDTTYHVTATNSAGCASQADVIVRVSQPFTVQVSDAEVCAGQSIQLHASGAVNYQWSPATGLSSATTANPLAFPDSTTTYTVTGSGSDACFTDTKTATVTVHALPQINAGEDMQLGVGTSIVLPATGSSDITDIEWSPATGLSCIDCLRPTASPKQSITYHVTVSNDFGCKNMDDITITMICESGSTFLPNTFTPNGDGQNDIFYIRGKGVKSVKSFRIFNRWGQQVFERTNFGIEDPLYGWDGKQNGQLVNPDVFIYIIELICDTNEAFTIKGNVMLLR
ncbi:PKD domain-containing protein [Chitinophaga tropicalis]|nr:PKD domain-containing protein [Chitinophaga tropicalis]